MVCETTTHAHFYPNVGGTESRDLPFAWLVVAADRDYHQSSRRRQSQAEIFLGHEKEEFMDSFAAGKKDKNCYITPEK